MEDVAHWLLDWFKRRSPVPGEDAEQQIRLNYYDEGLIDSFGVIELINEIEEHFGIEFSEDNFQDRRFPTIEGLSNLIIELMKSKSHGSSERRGQDVVER